MLQECVQSMDRQESKQGQTWNWWKTTIWNKLDLCNTVILERYIELPSDGIFNYSILWDLSQKIPPYIPFYIPNQVSNCKQKI